MANLSACWTSEKIALLSLVRPPSSCTCERGARSHAAGAELGAKVCAVEGEGEAVERG